ncbi:MAG: hypothetical protein V1784_04320 [bacterium]
MSKGLFLTLLLILTLPIALFAGTPIAQQRVESASVLLAPPEKDISTYNDGWIDVIPVPLQGSRTSHLDVFDSTVPLDDFENSPPESTWTHSDLSVMGTFWHLDDTLALGGSGLAWYCGDVNMYPGMNGGAYNDHWFQILRSDTFSLVGATAPTLAFKAHWKVEAPGGEPVGYNMWDGWNVWVSTNAGGTWSVLAPSAPSPAYTGTSSYAFGLVWGYGPGIPAWGGTGYVNNFTAFQFNLATYVGNANVMVRWVICSDNGFSGLDDSSYYGLVVDSIRIKDGAVTILSNDGTADEFTQGEGPPFGDTWAYDNTTFNSPDTCWTATVDTNLWNGVVSYPVALPTGYTRLSIRYYVWCHMLDEDGDNDNSLDDYYHIDVSSDNGASWQNIVYDYGYDNGEAPPGGNSLTGWVKRTKGLKSGGVQQPFIDLGSYAGQTIRIRFRVTTDWNDDGGVGTGLHIDDVEVVATRAYDHDLACTKINVPFPTTQGLSKTFYYTILNEGLSQEGNVIRSQYWIFRPNGTTQQTASPVLTGTLLDLGEDTFFTASWTPDVTGSYLLRARSNLLTDEDRSNDTAWTPTNVPLNSDSNLAVTVRPAGEYELAYHTRAKASAYLNPRYVRYTPAADSVPSGVVNAYDITTIRVMWQYDEVLADTGATTWIEFWEAGTPTSPGALINRIPAKIDTSETVGSLSKPHWWTLDVTGKIGLQNRSGNFWVSLTPKDSIGGGPVPLPMGKSSEPAAYDGHHFVIRLDTAGTPLNPSPGRYLLQTTIKPAADPNPPALVGDLVIWRDDNTNDLLLDWGPALHATGYHVYRLTTPYQTYTTGTRLTSLPITATEFRDVGVVPTGAKFFYVVVGIN